MMIKLEFYTTSSMNYFRIWRQSMIDTDMVNFLLKRESKNNQIL